MKGRGGGEIVEVEGGHILRSIGRKDRHSKVYTAKGPRDRRVRLAAHTAIQFYDVQDRLGYDRPSRAVDWLIKKAKNAIEKLDELPPWNPPIDCPLDHPSSSAVALEQQPESSSGYAFQLQKQLGIDPSGGSSFIPPPVETQCHSDSMKPFFPTNSGNSLINFQYYPNNVLSSASNNTEDLGLSLQTLQAPNSTNRTFDTNYPKGGDWSGDENEYRMGVFNSQLITQQIQYSESSALHQRESLQSSFSHLFHAWENRSLQAEDHHHSTQAAHKFSIPEFQVPASIEGEEDPGMVPVRQSSSSPLAPY